MLNSQRHANTCVPVAIKNILEHKQIAVSYKDIVKFSKDFELSAPTSGNKNKTIFNGMSVRNFKRVLKEFGITYKVKYSVSAKDISKALNGGKTVALCYVWLHNDIDGCHLVFIDKQTPKYFRAWNWAKKAKPYMSKKLLSYWFKRAKQKFDFYPCCVIID